jgi:hypothetical protein
MHARAWLALHAWTCRHGLAYTAQHAWTSMYDPKRMIVPLCMAWHKWPRTHGPVCTAHAPSYKCKIVYRICVSLSVQRYVIKVLPMSVIADTCALFFIHMLRFNSYCSPSLSLFFSPPSLHLSPSVSLSLFLYLLLTISLTYSLSVSLTLSLSISLSLFSPTYSPSLSNT